MDRPGPVTPRWDDEGVFLQADKYSCGACAIVNALRALGTRIAVPAVAKLAGTHPIRGTPDAGMRRAVRLLGFRARTFNAVGPSIHAVAALRGHLISGSPVLLTFDRGEHWVAAVGVLGLNVLIADSADGELVVSLDPKELAARWREKQGPHDVFSGIIIETL